MKTWMMALLACGLAMGCIEENSSTDDSGVTEPEPSPPEPEAQPEPQPEAQPEPQPEAQPEPQPEAQPEPQPEAQPEPQPEAQPEPQPEAQPEPPPEPEPQPAPEPEGPIDNCAEACARVDLCLTRECAAPAGATAALCADLCAGQGEAVIAVVSGADSCAELVETIRGLVPEVDALCSDEPQPEPEPEGPIGACADACGEIDQCLISECGAAPGAFAGQCAQACDDFGDALPAIVAGLACGDLVEQLRALSLEIDAICDGGPEPEPAPGPFEGCPEVCAHISECFAQECSPLTPEQQALCVDGCAENPVLLPVINSNPECGAVVNTLVNLAPDFAQLCADRLTCDAVCDRIIRDCGGDPGNANERAACVAGCAEANPNQAELRCAFTAQCEDVQACQGEPPPDGDLEAECLQACTFLAECQNVGAIPECVEGCIAESTPEQRACVNALDRCEDFQMCLIEP